METIRPLMFKDLKVGEKYKRSAEGSVWVKTGPGHGVPNELMDTHDPKPVKDSLHVERVE